MGLFDKFFIDKESAEFKEKEAQLRAIHAANLKKKEEAKARRQAFFRGEPLPPKSAPEKKPQKKAPSKKRTTSSRQSYATTSDYTYIKDTTLKSKSSMQNLGELVCPSVPQSKRTPQMLTAGSKSLLDTLSRHADKLYGDAIKAADPKTFFNCIDTCDRDYTRMSCIEEYVQYGGIPSNIARYHMNERLQIEVRHLIDRMAAAAKEAPDPDAAMLEAYQQLKGYEKRMDEQSIKKLNSKFKKYIG